MRRPTAEVARFAAMLVVFVSSGLAITWLLLPPPPVPVAELPVVPLRIAGEVIEPGPDAIGDALDHVRRHARGQLILELPDGTEHPIARPDFGVEIDRARLAGLLEAARRPGGAIQRAYAESSLAQNHEPLELPLPLQLDTERAIDKLMALKLDLDKASRDAFVDLETRKLVKEQIGRRLDVYGTLARIDAALREGRERVEARFEKSVPHIVSADLGNVEFDHVLGWFETRYNRAKRSEDRTYNLRLAASKLDGAVVLPGEEFDFNAVVGPRDEASGYRVAPVIAQGELVDGLGGGTCQVSGTLHGAAFFAGLEIVERYPHSRPSFYIKLGLDATVVYPTINYRFRNPFSFPIVLHQTVKDGRVRAEILGPKRVHTVTYFRRIDDILPFEEVVRETDKLPKGKRIVTQRGIPGFRTTSSRLRRDGAYGVREKWTDKYPPTTQIIAVGTGKKGTKARKTKDNHPEYRVAEYLVVTQGPTVRTPGVKGPEPAGGVRERREPGRTGERGWIEKMGMAGSLPDIEGEGDQDEKEKDEKEKDEKRKKKEKRKKAKN